MRTLLLGVAGTTGAAAGLVALLAWAFRTRSQPVLDRVRRFNRAVSNPRQLAGGAGGPGAWASVVEHVGRTSGRTYRTPVGAVDAGDGRIVVPLPYGPDTDWVRNLLAAGGGLVHHDGVAVPVRDPEVVGPDAVVGVGAATRADRAAERLFGVRQHLVLHRAPTGTADG